MVSDFLYNLITLLPSNQLLSLERSGKEDIDLWIKCQLLALLQRIYFGQGSNFENLSNNFFLNKNGFSYCYVIINNVFNDFFFIAKICLV